MLFRSYENVIKKAILLSFLFLVFISSALPSGTFFGIPFKQIAFAIVPILILLFISLGSMQVQVCSFKPCVYLIIITTLFMYLLYAFFVSNATTDMILKDFQFIFVLFLFFVYLELTMVANNLSLEVMLRYIATSAFWGVFLFALTKTVVIFLLLLGVIDFAFVENVLFQIINYTPVGLSIELIGSRFSFVTLDLLSTVIYALLVYNKKYFTVSKININLFYLLFAISIFSAYSRLLFAFLILFTYFALLLNRQYKALLTVSIVILLVASLNIDLIKSIIENRFLSQEHSDSHRSDMLYYLTLNWKDYPIFGSGFGSYVPKYIRSDDLTFSYEMQLLSVFMRFGLPVVFALLFIETYYVALLFKLRSRDILYVFMLFNSILISSMTNQYLFSSQSAVMFILIYLMTMSAIYKNNAAYK